MIARKITRPRSSWRKKLYASKVITYITTKRISGSVKKCTQIIMGGHFLAGNLGQYAKEMTALTLCYGGRSNPYGHYVLSLTIGEWIDKALFDKMVTDFISMLGLRGCIYVAALHENTLYKHIHIFVNKIDQRTKKMTRINHGYDIRKMHQVSAVISYKYGLSRCRKGFCIVKEVDGAHCMIENGREKFIVINPAHIISADAFNFAKSCLTKAKSWQELVDALKEREINFWRVAKGAVLEVEGKYIPASSFGDGCGLFSLQSRFGSSFFSYLQKENYHGKQSEQQHNQSKLEFTEPDHSDLEECKNRFSLRTMCACHVAWSGWKGSMSELACVLQGYAFPSAKLASDKEMRWAIELVKTLNPMAPRNKKTLASNNNVTVRKKGGTVPYVTGVVRAKQINSQLFNGYLAKSDANNRLYFFKKGVDNSIPRRASVVIDKDAIYLCSCNNDDITLFKSLADHYFGKDAYQKYRFDSILFTAFEFLQAGISLQQSSTTHSDQERNPSLQWWDTQGPESP